MSTTTHNAHGTVLVDGAASFPIGLSAPPPRGGTTPAGSDALDLSQRAPGLALELALKEEVTFTLLVPLNREGRPATTTKFLFTPTRPGAVLDEARRRRLPVK